MLAQIEAQHDGARRDGSRKLGTGARKTNPTFLAMGLLRLLPPSLAASLDARSTESWGMPDAVRPQKITFGEMRESGIDRVRVYCADYKCSHSVEMSADRWPDDLRISDIEDQFVCRACGKHGADVRPNFAPAGMGTG
jgi:hypothetical protein